jgi:hypothetical protein
MSPIQRLILILVILFIIACVYGYIYRKDLIRNNPFLDKLILERGLEKPVIWLYYDNSDVNSRYWSDFGSRSSRVLNVPFLNLCYESIVKQNHKDYRIEVISGLSGLAELLGGIHHLPSGLQNLISPINNAEMNWIRATVLQKFGGLWLSPYTVCIKPFGKLPDDKVVFFGTDLDETYSGSKGTTIPGFTALWSPKSKHPMFNEWSSVSFDRIEHKKGGQQIRGDEKWDFVRFSTEYPNVIINPHAEGMRKKNGKRVQLEDLLAAGIDGVLPFDVNPNTIYIPFPWNELRDRELFGWFLRMSEKQIMESDIAVKYLLQSSLQ